MKRPKVSIEQGQIRVNCVGLLAWHKNAFVLDIDCRQKYPVVEMTSERSLWIGFNDQTLYVKDKDAPLTKVTWQIEGEWWISVSVGRYSVMVFAVRKREPRDSWLWPDDGTECRRAGKDPTP